MKKAELREQVLDAVIKGFYQPGIDPVGVSLGLFMDMVVLLKNDVPNGSVAHFWNSASDHQWTLIQREFRIWQHNEPHRLALARKRES